MGFILEKGERERGRKGEREGTGWEGMEWNGSRVGTFRVTSRGFTNVAGNAFETMM
jgi:hypothetical protein